MGLSFLWLPSKGISCTLFGAIGNSVEGGGVLIGKTRDRPQCTIYLKRTPLRYGSVWDNPVNRYLAVSPLLSADS